MGAVKELLAQVQDNITAHKYAEALELLKPWGEDAPPVLWDTLADLANDYAVELPSEYLPWQTRRRLTTPDDLRELADWLEDQDISGLNVALALDLLVRDYSAPNN